MQDVPITCEREIYMMFQMNTTTLKELLENPRIKDIAPDAVRGWDLTKEDFYNDTLSKLAEERNWLNLKSGFERLFEISDRGEYYFRLYSKEECATARDDKERHERQTANIVYFPSDDMSASNRPFILLIPGGGFVNVWNMTEGWPVAKCFNELGYNVFILTYQVGIERTAVNAMIDIAKAMNVIRSHKDEFGVNPDLYITCGFSAGGYIACLWNTQEGYRAYDIPKPQACIPIYPVTYFRLMYNDEFDDGDDLECFACTGDPKANKSCERCFGIPMHVEGFPKTAIFVAAKDDLVCPKHSIRLAEAIKEAGILCRLEVGPTGGHGFSDGIGMCMEGWPKRAIDWITKELISNENA